jgi:hypothetical protein
MMLSFINRLLNRLRPIPRRWFAAPRMPESFAEAEQVFRRWDSLNGRSYFLADVLLEGGRFLTDVTFDGDTRIAVRHGRLPVYRQLSLVSQPVAAWLVTKDRTPGKPFGNATEDERRRFQEEHAGDLTASPALLAAKG